MTRMPKVVEVAEELAGKKPHQGVNPDEVVAVGRRFKGRCSKETCGMYCFSMLLP